MKVYKVGEKLPDLFIKEKTTNKFYTELAKLEIGESLEILKDEWKYKSEPYPRLNQDTNPKKKTRISGMKFSCHRLAFNNGWLITRIIPKEINEN